MNVTWPSIMICENQWDDIYLIFDVEYACWNTDNRLWKDNICKAHLKMNLPYLNSDIQFIIFKGMAQRNKNYCKYLYDLRQYGNWSCREPFADRQWTYWVNKTNIVINSIYETHIILCVFRTVGCCNEVAGIDLKVMMQSDGNILIVEEI